VFNNLELIIYDLDGVLLDSEKGILETFKVVMEKLSLSYEEETLKSLIGFSLPDIFKKTLPEEKHHLIQKASQIYRQNYVPIALKETVLIEGVEETLSFMKSFQIKQSIATNKSGPEAKKILIHLSIMDYFDLMVGFFDVKNPKPAPDMIHLIIEKLRVNPENTVLIEDSLVGLTSGKRAGVRTIAVTTGADNRETLQSGNPDQIIDNLKELMKLI
jgi:phosphoglycolate phosphatase-like HAD superfamily hydrolase